MIEITSKEARHLNSLGYHCPKTCRLKNKGKSRGKFYCAEEKKILEALENYRKTEVVIYTYGEL